MQIFVRFFFSDFLPNFSDRGWSHKVSIDTKSIIIAFVVQEMLTYEVNPYFDKKLS